MSFSKNKKIELPQHVYMRIAMSLFYKEPKEIRIKWVKDFYDVISQHHITMATPIMLNSGTRHQQLSSCVLSAVGDDTVSIMDVAKDVAIYSKNKGGTAIDISKIFTLQLDKRETGLPSSFRACAEKLYRPPGTARRRRAQRSPRTLRSRGAPRRPRALRSRGISRRPQCNDPLPA